MFYLSVIGTRNGANAISTSRSVSLHSIRDLSKKFRKSCPIPEKGRAKLKVCLVHALLQFCKDNLSVYDVKRAEIYRLEK